MPDKISPQSQQPGSRKSAYGADEQKFSRGKMSEAKDVTEQVLGCAGDQEEEEDEEGPFMMEQVVILGHGLLTDKLLDKGPAKDLRKPEGYEGTERKPDGRQNNTERGTIEKPAEKTGYLTRYGSGHNLEDLQGDKAQERQRTEGIKERKHPLLVHEKMERPGLIQDKKKKKKQDQNR